MLKNNEYGYAVMSEDLTAFSFKSPDINACKKYCKKGYVVVEQIPYPYGKNISIYWIQYYRKLFYLNLKDRGANIYYLHFRWRNEYAHKNGKIRYRG